MNKKTLEDLKGFLVTIRSLLAIALIFLIKPLPIKLTYIFFLLLSLCAAGLQNYSPLLLKIAKKNNFNSSKKG